MSPIRTSQSNIAPLNDFIDAQRHFFGLTDSFGHNYHVQSYFFGLGSNSHERLIVSDFFRSLQPTSNKPEVIGTGELAIGRDLLNNNGVVGVMCPYVEVAKKFLVRASSDMARLIRARRYNDSSSNNRLLKSIEERIAWIEHKCSDLAAGIAHNPTHLFWKELIVDFGYPFIKKELLLKNPVAVANIADATYLLTEKCGETFEQYVELCMTGGTVPRASFDLTWLEPREEYGPGKI